MRVLIQIFNFLRLYILGNVLQRLLRERKAPKAPLPLFKAPEEVVEYIRKKFNYRLDGLGVGALRVPFDWISHPEVVQHRLETGEPTGDCDDYHYWVARQLEKIESVKKVFLLSVGYSRGGHTCCVFETEEGWFLVDYDLFRIDTPTSAVRKVVSRYRPGEQMGKWYWFYDTNLRAKAIFPDKLEP